MNSLWVFLCSRVHSLFMVSKQPTGKGRQRYGVSVPLVPDTYFSGNFLDFCCLTGNKNPFLLYWYWTSSVCTNAIVRRYAEAKAQQSSSACVKVLCEYEISSAALASGAGLHLPWIEAVCRSSVFPGCWTDQESSCSGRSPAHLSEPSSILLGGNWNFSNLYTKRDLVLKARGAVADVEIETFLWETKNIDTPLSCAVLSPPVLCRLFVLLCSENRVLFGCSWMLGPSNLQR